MIFVECLLYDLLHLAPMLNEPGGFALAALDVIEPGCSIDLHGVAEDMAVVLVLQQIHLFEFVTDPCVDRAAYRLEDLDHLLELLNAIDGVEMILGRELGVGRLSAFPAVIGYPPVNCRGRNAKFSGNRRY